MMIYLTTQGTCVRMEQGRLLIEEGRQGGLLRSIPKEQVDAIAIFG